jgi:hypothetical protein
MCGDEFRLGVSPEVDVTVALWVVVRRADDRLPRERVRRERLVRAERNGLDDDVAERGRLFDRSGAGARPQRLDEVRERRRPPLRTETAVRLR